MSHFDTIRKEEVKLKIRPFVIQMRGKVEVATNFCSYATAGWKIVTLGLPPVSKTEKPWWLAIAALGDILSKPSYAGIVTNITRIQGEIKWLPIKMRHVSN